VRKGDAGRVGGEHLAIVNLAGYPPLHQRNVLGCWEFDALVAVIGLIKPRVRVVSVTEVSIRDGRGSRVEGALRSSRHAGACFGVANGSAVELLGIHDVDKVPQIAVVLDRYRGGSTMKDAEMRYTDIYLDVPSIRPGRPSWACC
jgi:hypothetical protein